MEPLEWRTNVPHRRLGEISGGRESRVSRAEGPSGEAPGISHRVRGDRERDSDDKGRKGSGCNRDRTKFGWICCGPAGRDIDRGNTQRASDAEASALHGAPVVDTSGEAAT